MEKSFGKLVLRTMSTVLMLMFLFGSVCSPNILSRLRSSLNRSSADKSTAQNSSDFKEIVIKTDKGDIEARHYETPKTTKRAVVFLAGSDGGWDGPGHRSDKAAPGQMYPELGTKLKQKGIASLQIKYRVNHHLEECTFDALEGLKYLKKQGIEIAGIVGHSFGGAVICQAAAQAQAQDALTGMVKALVALATVSKDVEPIAKVKGVASLFITGTRDISYPISHAETVYGLAPEPKKLMVDFVDTHGFRDNSVVEEIETEIINWFNQYLKK